MLNVARLRLEDFKSFAGLTELDLEPGVSIVVGPNGSGKSNLLDALGFVFGERDPAVLRAERLDDLCYRDPSGRAASCSVFATVALDGTEASGERALEVGRGIGPGGEWYSVDGERLSRFAFLSALHDARIPAPLFTVVRQGDVGRLLWLHADERTELLVEHLLRGPAEETSPGNGRLALERARLLASLAPPGGDPRLASIQRQLGLPFVEGRDSVPGDAAGRLADLLAELDPEPAAEGPGGAAANAPGGGSGRPAAENPRLARFLDLHGRIEQRLETFFGTLIPGGVATLPLVEPASPGRLPGVALSVRFPGKPATTLDALSGGQRAILGLSLALAAFLDAPSPALVLDEVEPALDDFLVRRLSRVLHDVGRDRQIIVVSHQRIMHNTARHVMQVGRQNGASRIRLRYDPQTLRGPSAPPR